MNKITVRISTPKKEIVVTASLEKYTADGNDKLIHVVLEPARSANNPEDKRKAIRRTILDAYWAFTLETREAGKLKAAERDSIQRILDLGEVYFAHRPRESDLEERQLPRQELAKAGNEDENVLPASSTSGLLQRADDEELFNTAGQMLLESGVPTQEDKEYYDFERGILTKWREICQRCKSLEESHAEMEKYIDGIRKHADDKTRRHLGKLALAYETAYHDMYQYEMGEVMRDPQIVQALDPVSLRYNRWAHAAQDKLGGMVPALHPFWKLVLRNPQSVASLRRYSNTPTPSQAEVEEVNAIIAAAIVRYRHLLEKFLREEEQKDRRVVSLNQPVHNEEGETTMDVQDPHAMDPSEAADIRLMVRELMEGSEDDPDLGVIKSIYLENLKLGEVCKKHGCSPSEVDRRRAAGLKKLKKKADQLGVTSFYA